MHVLAVSDPWAIVAKVSPRMWVELSSLYARSGRWPWHPVRSSVRAPRDDTQRAFKFMGIIIESIRNHLYRMTLRDRVAESRHNGDRAARRLALMRKRL